jgi:beta-phosphoglucomutase family hydrolase
MSVRGVVFDLDGVLTDTAALHFAAWRELFDGVLGNAAPLTLDEYRRYVDGRGRTEGVAALLAARHVTLPQREPGDPPSIRTVHGLAARKDELYVARLARDGPRPFPSSVTLLRTLRAAAVPVAVASASHHCRQVLDAAGLAGLIDAIVDGVDADRLHLPGKPDPALFLEAARRLGVPPAQAAVIEDAEAGVEAGRRGGFGLVVGVARQGDERALRDRGADLVVGDLGELPVELLTGHARGVTADP